MAAAQFGLRLLSQLVKKSPGENVVISPIGPFQALSLFSFLANEEICREIHIALKIDRLGDASLHAMYDRLAEHLQIESRDVELACATAFWLGNNVVLDDSLTALAEQWCIALFRGAEVTTASMREWSEKQTRGRLSASLSAPSGNGAVLMNAVYFRGTWQSQFATDDTQNRLFHRMGGLPRFARLMRQQTRGIQLYRGGDFDAVQIPYSDGGSLAHELSLHVILPHRPALNHFTTSDYVTPFVEQFTLADWDTCQSRYQEAVVDLILPRFVFRQTHDLLALLRQLGIGKALQANTSQMSPRAGSDPPPSIEQFRQQIYLSADETGTEAAALTEMSAALGSSADYVAPPRPRIEKFYANRPFLFLLTEEASGQLLFAGVIHDPKN